MSSEAHIGNLLSPEDGPVIRPSPESVFCRLDGELVLLNYRVGTYFALRGTGAAIWELIERGCTRDALCRELSTRFQVDAETCRNDVTEFLADLAAHGLIEATR